MQAQKWKYKTYLTLHAIKTLKMHAHQWKYKIYASEYPANEMRRKCSPDASGSC